MPDRKIFPTGDFDRRAFLGSAAALGGAFVLDRSGLLSVPDYLFGSKNLNPEKLKADIGNFLARAISKHPDFAEFAQNFAGKIAGLGAGEALADELIAREGFYLRITQDDGTGQPIPIKVARDYFNTMVAVGFKVTAIWDQAPNGQFIGYIDDAPEIVNTLRQVNPKTAVTLLVGEGEKPKPEAPKAIEGFNRELAQRAGDLINAKRVEAGIAPWRFNPVLVVAEEQYDQLVVKLSQQSDVSLLGHYLDGNTPDQRAQKMGYNGSAAEILAASAETTPPKWKTATAEDFIYQWLNDEAHREGIYSPYFQEMGPACYFGSARYLRGGTLVVCGVALGRPR